MTKTMALKVRNKIFKVLMATNSSTLEQRLFWCFICQEYKQYLMQVCLSEKRRNALKQDQFQRLFFCLGHFPNLLPFKLILLQFRKGSKEQDYLQILQQLPPSRILTEFIFKDRLFGCVSQYGYHISCQEGQSREWLEIEEKARK
jgi:hypothetical protein